MYIYIMTYLNKTPHDISDVSPAQKAQVFAPIILDALAREDDGLEQAVDDLTLSLAPYAPADMAVMGFDDRDCHEGNEDALDFTGAKGLTYTSRLRGLMPIFIAQLFSMFDAYHVQRGARARLWDIRKALGALYRAEKQNFITALTQALTDNPFWRAQVREDLGGEAALARWEARRARGLNPSLQRVAETDVSSFVRPPTPKTGKPRKSAGVKTDSSGLFRLAALVGARKPQSVYTRAALSPRRIGQRFFMPKAIGLTPDQLRDAPMDAARAQETNKDGDSPDFREDLLDIWHKMHARFDLWNDHLVDADLMLGSSCFRRAYKPP